MMISELTIKELKKFDGKIVDQWDFATICSCPTVSLYQANIPVVKTVDGIALDIFSVKLEDGTYITVSRDSRDYDNCDDVVMI